MRAITKKRTHADTSVQSALSVSQQLEARTALDTCGFYVLRNFVDLSGVSPALLDDLKQRMRKRKETDYIFNGQGKVDPTTQDTTLPVECGDRARLQLFFNKARMPAHITWLLQAIQARTQEVFPASHQACDHVFLLSERGCDDQTVHCDYDPSDHATPFGGGWPLGCLIALEPDSALNVWPGSIDFDANKRYHHERMALNAGDLLLFRGDLVHSGASYLERSNLRVHCFMDRWDAVERGDNGTYFMDKCDNVEAIKK